MASTSVGHDLPKVMQIFQREVSRRINLQANRKNHLFGDRYQASIIKSENYYYYALKYLYRNPIESGLCCEIENYNFSTLSKYTFKIHKPANGIDSLISYNRLDFLNYINEDDYSNELHMLIEKRISQKEFAWPKRMNKSVRNQIKFR